MKWSRLTSTRWWIAWAMAAVLVLSLVSWVWTLPGGSGRLVIATGQQGGQYYKFGQNFRDALLHQAERELVVVETAGSVENRAMLLSGEADLAIIQAGSVSLNKMAVIAPLHHDVSFVIVRNDRGISTISELADKQVVLGPTGSGMRAHAKVLLGHYGLLDRVVDAGEVSFDRLVDPEYDTLDAAIVTTGLDNSTLRSALATGQFKLLSVNARAMSAGRAFYREFQLPSGFFSEQPLMPVGDVETVSTTALLVVRQDAPNKLVRDALNALYVEDFHDAFPYLISHEEAALLPPVRLHPEARRYFDPFDHVGWFAAVMESIAATKELLFALGAGLYLLWDRQRRQKIKARERQMSVEKELLDSYLERTFLIEREQMQVTDNERLQELLAAVTSIKLEALEELTHEDLRADRSFSIFLTQCATLISKIQLKMVAYALRDSEK